MIKLSWIGSPCVEVDGAPLRFETRKVTALLAYLSLNPQGSSREKLAALFWPEYDQAHSLANLRRALSSLARTLPSGIIEADREAVRWNPLQAVEVDVLKAHDILKQVRGHYHEASQECSTCYQLLESAADLYRGEFLEGFNLPDCPNFDDWQDITREEIKREFSAIFEQAANAAANRSDWAKALSAARRRVGLDRLDNNAQAALVRIYVHTGQRSLAVRQTEEYTRLLKDELGLEPDPVTQEAFRQALLSELPSPVPARPEANPATQASQQILLKTKLYIPAVKPRRVPRLRLLAALNKACEHKLTLVSAPAGFGKTSLLADWVARVESPVGWLSLDRSDNDPNRFLGYLCAVFDSLREGLGAQAQALMKAGAVIPPLSVVQALLKEIEQVSDTLVVVLDDYQFIGSPAIQEALAYLVERSSANLHLVISSRSDPPFPLARLRSRGELLEIRTEDLRFTDEEANAFFIQVMNLDLMPADAQALSERTEGWIAGLQMASIALQPLLSARERKEVHRFIEGFSGTNRYILDYLLEEVLANQPLEIQRFLLNTSVLDRMTGSLCDAVLAASSDKKTEGGWLGALSAGWPAGLGQYQESLFSGSSVSMLEYLERANLFLVPLDYERQWYRYHHLFADLLRIRLKQAQPALVPLLHLRAAGWMENHGLIAEAVRHAFAAGDECRAADLIERYGGACWAEGDISVVQMADSLSPEMIQARPKIGLYQVWRLTIQGQTEKIVVLLDSLDQQLSSMELERDMQWLRTVAMLERAFHFPQMSLPGFDTISDSLTLDEIPPEEVVLRDAAEILYCMALARRGGLDRSAEVSLKFIERKRTPRSSAIPTLVAYLARIYLIQGRLKAAASLCREYLDPIREKGISLIATAGSMDIVLGEVQYEWNFIEEAEKQIRGGLQENEPWRNIMTESCGLIALVRILQGRGDFAGALEVVDKFETLLQGLSRPREFDDQIRTLRVRVQLASGDLQSAVHWAEQVLQSEDFQLYPHYYRLTLACIRLKQGLYEEVEEILAGKTISAVMGSRIQKQVQSNLLRAAAMAARQCLPQALRLIEESLNLAEPEGYIRTFLDAGEPARELLAAYVNSAAPAQRQYALKLLDAFRA